MIPLTRAKHSNVANITACFPWVYYYQKVHITHTDNVFLIKQIIFVLNIFSCWHVGNKADTAVY